MLCEDKTGMLKQLTTVISDDDTNIRHMDVKTDNLDALIDVVVDIQDTKHLDRLVNGIRKIHGVRDVQRIKKL